LNGLVKRIKMYYAIYMAFLKIGTVSFGGGYAAISLIERDIVQNRKWVEKEDIIDIFSVSQSLPGAIALNTSAFVGYAVSGIPGSLFALAGTLTSPVIIMTVLSSLVSVVRGLPVISSAFMGIYPAITALVAYAGFCVGKTAVNDCPGIIILLSSFFLSLFLNMHPILLIIAGAIAGIAITIFRKNGKEKH